ncbi:MAG: hypothetical protein FWG64_07475 [Firmicutes bacterium]|nr:hypothetical protein [Bacillota bacterium]
MIPGTEIGITDVNIDMTAALTRYELDVLGTPPGSTMQTLYAEDLWGLRWLVDVQRITVTINRPHAPIEFPDLSGLPNLREVNFQGFNFIQTPTMATTIASRLPASLQVLDLSNTNLVGVLDFTGSPALNNLVTLDLSNNSLTSVIIGNNMPALQTLDVSRNQLTTLNIADPSTNQLRTIDANWNNLTAFPNLTNANFTLLESLSLANNNIMSFSATNHNNFVNLDLSFNPPLTSVTLNNLPRFTTLWAFDGGNLTTANLQNLPLLNEVAVQRNSLATLDLSNLPNLQLLNASENLLNSILLDGANNLQDVRLFDNFLTSINIPASNAMTMIQLQRNLLSAFSVDGFPNLRDLGLSFNQIPYSGRIPQIGGNWQSLFNIVDPGTDTSNGWTQPTGFVFFPQLPSTGVTPPPPPLNTINVNGVNVPFTTIGTQMQLNMTATEISAINATFGTILIDISLQSGITSVSLPQAAWNAFAARDIEIRYFNGIVNLNALAVNNIATQFVGAGNVVVQLESPALLTLTPAQQAAVQVGNDTLRTLQITAGTNNIGLLTAGSATITIPTPFNLPHTVHHIAANGVVNNLVGTSTASNVTFGTTNLGLLVARSTSTPPTASIIINGVTVPITVIGSQMQLNIDAAMIAGINATSGTVLVDVTNHGGISNVTFPQAAWAAFTSRPIEIRYFNGTVNFNQLAVANILSQQIGTTPVAVAFETPAFATLPPAQQAAVQTGTDILRRVQVTAGTNNIAALTQGNVTVTIPTPLNVSHNVLHIAANGVTTALSGTSTANNVTFNVTTLGLFAARSGLPVATNHIIINGVTVPFTLVGSQMQLNMDATMISAISATPGNILIDVTNHGGVTSVTTPQVAWNAFVNRSIEFRFFNGTINLAALATASVAAQQVGAGAVVVEFDSPLLAALTPQQQSAIIVGSDFWRRVQIMAGTNNIVNLTQGSVNITIPTPFNVSHTVHHLAINGAITPLTGTSAAANINFNATSLGVFVVRSTGTVPPTVGTSNITVNGASVGLSQSGNQVNINMPANLVQEIARNAITNTVSFYLGNQHGATQAVMPTEAIQLFANSGYALEFVLPDGTLQLDTLAAQSVAQQTNAANAAFRIENMTQGDMTPAQANAVNQNNMVVRVQLLNGNLPIPNIHGFVTITVPVSGLQNPGAWHIAPDGTRTQLEATATGDSVSFRANRFSAFEIGEDFPVNNVANNPYGMTIVPLTFEIGGQQPTPPPAPPAPPQEVVIPPAPPAQPDPPVVVQPAPADPPPQVAVNPPAATPAPVVARPNPRTEDAPLPVSPTFIALSAIFSGLIIIGVFLICRKKLADKKKTQEFVEMRNKTL